MGGATRKPPPPPPRAHRKFHGPKAPTPALPLSAQQLLAIRPKGRKAKSVAGPLWGLA